LLDATQPNPSLSLL